MESRAASRLSYLFGYTCTAGTAQPTPPAACKTRTAWQGHTDIRFTLRETATRSIRWNALAMIVCGDPSPQHLNTGSITCLPNHSLTSSLAKDTSNPASLTYLLTRLHVHWHTTYTYMPAYAARSRDLLPYIHTYMYTHLQTP